MQHQIGDCPRKYKDHNEGSSHCGASETNPTSIHENVSFVPDLVHLSELRIQHCHELWCSSQTQLRSCVVVAVAQAGSCSSNQIPSLGTSICHGCGPKKWKKKKKIKVYVTGKGVAREWLFGYFFPKEESWVKSMNIFSHQLSPLRLQCTDL